MINISELILQQWRQRSKVKMSANGWWSGNAPCCIHNAETQDKRGRGGLKDDGSGGFVWHCFNCNYTTKYQFGHTLGDRSRKLLQWFGVDDLTINEINLDSIRNRSMEDFAHDRVKQIEIPTFKEQHLPPGARPITLNDKKFIDYLSSRGLTVQDYSFKITPNASGRNKNRIIVPYTFDNKVVGWTSRYLDNHKTKYLNEHQQPGYVFGLDFQHNNWNYGIVMEGIFDAISIKGMALMHNEFSETQLAMIRNLGKEIIVVPDQDKAGMVLAYEAIEAGFAISVPNWGKNTTGAYVNDVNEAVQKFGRAGTLLSIIHAKETSKIKITVALNNMKRRLNIK